ncbi:Glycoprotein Hormone (FLR-2) Interacting protein [Caenorhabditis elegans]|uniref:Glycoprotein Hormone (FLR-2) Interacting protein n=1 Tax=Caenorhabditis elegans TaxID=6239 RepID=Q23448_CAEEL|nr:Glycoprotein Hormone (FLR-2) Interacting protein [Caenorhabditis elegans]CAA93777.1 Glycoprotein Hormone (FLR-2) Interacting protein [Caenorhabditis elegans]|eukprot:NP_496486.1 Glycoprotein Hormone (FLR-2) Interacting protein [Caenorhabditis elegans]
MALAGAEVVVKMTPKSVAHVFKKEMSSLHTSLLHLKPSPFQATYLGLEMTIDHLQVVDFKMPKLSYETSASQSHMTFKLLGGSARLLGQYSAVYKTKREGQFEMIFEHFHMSVPVKRTALTKFTVASDECTLEVDESMITMSPVLPEQISAKIKSDLLDQLKEAACSNATQFFSKLNSHLIHFAEATDISQGGHPSHIDVELHFQNPTSEDDTAIHVDVTESVVNAELSKLYSSANTRFIWNDVPEIKELLKSCKTTECRFIEDGDIVSSFFDRPSIRIQSDNTVSLRLPLSTSLTTTNGKELFRIQTEVELNLEDIVLEHPENGEVFWSAKFHIKNIRILQTSSSRNFQKFATRMESWIEEHKLFMENLLNTYIQGSLPVHLRSPLAWTHRVHARPIFSTSSLSFHVHPHFSPSLRVLV